MFLLNSYLLVNLFHFLLFTIQNVPIKFGFFLNSSAVVTVFTIQNVPIKLEDFYIEEESEDYLQYKMFLLNH